jgi:hypothetical protein
MTMNLSCPREAEVLDLVWTNQWPARADRALVEHAAACQVCRDLALVASAVGALNDDTTPAVKVPDASVVWYRAQVRARHELTRRATRPVVAAQLAAVVVGLIGVGAGWQLAGPAVAAWWLELSLPRVPPLGTWSELTGMTGWPLWRWMVGIVTVSVLTIPVALYVARMADRAIEPTQDRP